MRVIAYAPLFPAVATAAPRQQPSRWNLPFPLPPPPPPPPGWLTGAAGAVAAASAPVRRRGLLQAAAAAAAAAALPPLRHGYATTGASPLPPLPLPPSEAALSSVLDAAAAVAAEAVIADTAARLRTECGPFLASLACGGLPPAGRRSATAVVPPLAYRGATAGDEIASPAAAEGHSTTGLVAGARRVNPTPDLLDDATYGADGAAYFARLDRLLSASGVAVTPSKGHILTGDPAAAAAWGAPATVWPVGAFAYVWWPRATEVYTPADAATLLPPPPLPLSRKGGAARQAGGDFAGHERAAVAAAAAEAATARLAAAKGPLVVNEGLATALATGHEVLFVAAGGWWEVPAAASLAVARTVFELNDVGEGAPTDCAHYPSEL
ncbi:hypothetical protein MMPV_004207 [Pyropia vietnamensis]